ncbi:MAG: hypothetical protein QW240_06560 [Candidatus Caldarchaeum sp.]
MYWVDGGRQDACTTYTDRDGWYEWPVRLLRMRRRRKKFGRRNIIESWFSEHKRWIRQFNACFPIYRPKVPEKWIKALVTLS